MVKIGRGECGAEKLAKGGSTSRSARACGRLNQASSFTVSLPRTWPVALVQCKVKLGAGAGQV